MNTIHCDLLVIGAGAAGSTAATAAANNGARVVMVEQDKIGGTCLNYGCDPTKTLLNIATRLYQARHEDFYGLNVPDSNFSWPRVQKYVQQVLLRIRGGTSDEASQSLERLGIAILHGVAQFTDAHTITVDQEKIVAEHIIIASGSQSLIPALPGLQEAGFITNVEAIALPELPRRLAVVGGGAIGLEFAQMFTRFDVEVTVIEHSNQLLPKEDCELADSLCTLLNDEGIAMRTGVELRGVERISEGKKLTLRTQDGRTDTLLVDEILLAIGRRPNIAELRLDAAGIYGTDTGVTVDAELRTNLPYVWAAGDVIGDYQFTHVAYEQGKIAAHNAFSAQKQTFEQQVVPWVTYTDPPLAHVGKTEEELQAKNVKYKVGRMRFDEVERAISAGSTEGLVKLLLDPNGQILGGHILGARADDLLAPIVLAMQAKLPVSVLANTIMPYPTLSEAVRWAADRS